MVSPVLSGQNKWDHCTHLTWNLGHRMKWDHYKHPLSYHFVLCWSDFFSLDYICGYQYELPKGQCAYGFSSFVWAEQVRPLHTPYLKSGSHDEVRPLQAPLSYHFVLCWGWSFLIRLHLWRSIWAPKGSVCLCLYSFGWTEQVRPLHASCLKTGSLTEVRPLQAPFHITLCPLLGCCFHIKSYIWMPKGLFKCLCVHGLYCFVWAEQVRPLHASYLKTGSLA